MHQSKFHDKKTIPALVSKTTILALMYSSDMPNLLMKNVQ